MERLQLDPELLVRLARWAARLDVLLARLITHLLVVGVERLDQGAENVSALLREEAHGRPETTEGGGRDER